MPFHKRGNYIELSDSIRNLTFEDLINMPGSEVYIHNDQILARLRTPDGILQFSYGADAAPSKSSKHSVMPFKIRKMDYIDDIRRMKSEGMLQKDIARILDISEGYVSRLLNRQ